MLRRNIFLLLLVFFLVCSLIPARVTATAETTSSYPKEELVFFDARLTAIEKETPSNLKKDFLGAETRVRDFFHWLSSGNPMLWYRLVLWSYLDFVLFSGAESGSGTNAGSGSSASGGSGGSGGGSSRDDRDDDVRVPAFWLVPEYAEVVAGEAVAFQAKMAGRDSWPSGFPLKWSASGGRIDQNGTFTADQPGTYTVTATVQGKSAAAQVTVISPVTSIRVVPDEGEILVGETVEFRAELTGRDGQPLTDVPVAWSASGGRIDQQGTFTADQPGTYTVTATALDKSATAQVTVKALPEIDSIYVTPAQTVLLLGNSVTFQAVLMGTDGKQITDVPVVWSASGGRIDQQGTFTADQPGTYTVTATALGKSATAQVTVIRYQPPPPQPAPPELKLKPLPNRQDDEGDQVSFTVELTNPAVQNVEFSMSGAPNGVQIDPNTGEVSGTIAYDNVTELEMMKTFHVVVTATETTGLKRVATAEFTWTIGPEFKLKALPDRQDAEGDWVFSKAELTNPNLFSIQFSISGAPNGVQIDQYTGEIFGLILYDNVDEENEPMSEFHVVVTARETGGLKRVVTEEFTWKIGPEFVLEALPDRYNNEGDSINFKVELTNPNVQFVEFSMQRAPKGVQIDPETGVVSGTIDYDTVGDPNLRLIEFNVVVRATETEGLKRVSEVTFHWVIYDKSES